MPPMKKLTAFLALALASVALVACGGGSGESSEETAAETAGGGAAESGKKAGGEESSGGGGGSTLDLEADPNGELAYTTTEATAKAGKVTVDFNNPQGLTHDVAIEDEAGETVGQTELVADEETSTTVNLKPGTYHYYCTVPGHREAGMEGTLVVK
jgi:plastocyanin